jgi:hypothetical protein
VTTQIKIGAGGTFANVVLAGQGEISNADPQLATLNPDDLPVALEAVGSWRDAAATGETAGQALAQAQANSVNVFIQEV